MCMQVCVVWVLVCLDIPFTFRFNQISEFLQNTWITSCHINATFLVHILILCSFATSENSFKNFYHLSKISKLDEERMANERERAHTYGFWHKNRTPKKIECPTQSHVIHGKMNFWLVNAKLHVWSMDAVLKISRKAKQTNFDANILCKWREKKNYALTFWIFLQIPIFLFCLVVLIQCVAAKKKKKWIKWRNTILMSLWFYRSEGKTF